MTGEATEEPDWRFFGRPHRSEVNFDPGVCRTWKWLKKIFEYWVSCERVYRVNSGIDRLNVCLRMESEEIGGLTDPAFTENTTGRTTPEKAQAMLKEQGLEVSLEQAAVILCWLRQLVSISLLKMLKK